MKPTTDIMRTYSLSDFAKFDFAEIHEIQNQIDKIAQSYIDKKIKELRSVLPEKDIEQLRCYYSNTMEKYRLIHKAIVCNFDTPEHPGYPREIFNINLEDGSIERKNGRTPPYFVRHLAPCNSAMLHYKDYNNDIFVIIPPIKSVDRTIEKTIDETVNEYDEFTKKFFSNFKIDLDSIDDNPENCDNAAKRKSPINHARTPYKGKSIEEIINYPRLPKDIYRLTVTSRYRSDIEQLIRNMEKRFPNYIKFEKGERNQYEKNIDENPRCYFDIKKIAKITIPGTNESFYIEFQFKQTHMFFAHIRSHSAYEDYRVLEAKLNKLNAEKPKEGRRGEAQKKYIQLKKEVNQQRKLCVNIHRSAVHQSNLYLFRRLFWLNENANALHDSKERDAFAEHFLRENYIVESHEPFDGATAFTTNDKEYLNKSHYLKWLGVLPENFNEFGKKAKEVIMKEWKELSSTEIAQFDSITKMAIKYQHIIREIQNQGHHNHLKACSIYNIEGCTL